MPVAVRSAAGTSDSWTSASDERRGELPCARTCADRVARNRRRGATPARDSLLLLLLRVRVGQQGAGRTLGAFSPRDGFFLFEPLAERRRLL